MPNLEEIVQKAYQQAEELRIALHECLVQEGAEQFGRLFETTAQLADIVRLRLYELIKPGPPAAAQWSRPGEDGWVWFSEEVIRLGIPDVPPRYQSLKDKARETVAGHWAGRVQRLASIANPKPRFSPVFVFVGVAAPGMWDRDYRFLKPILDGLWLAEIIDAGDREKVHLHVRGLPLTGKKRPYVDIIVCSAEPGPPLPAVVEELLGRPWPPEDEKPEKKRRRRNCRCRSTP